MKLLLDANGNAVIRNGKPVYVKDDGTEVEFDVVATVGTIARLNNESKTHREAKEALEVKVKAYEGITDPEAARKALATVANLDQKKLVDAGQVEQVKTEAIKAVRAEYEPIVKERDSLKQQIVSEKIGGGFARSKFIAEKVAVPADIVQARFGSFFSMQDDGKVVAKDANGNVIYSDSRPGEVADFDEALAKLVDQYPYKAQILKGSGASGGGSGPSNGSGSGGKKTITRSAFEALPPQDRSAKLKDHELVDG
jgi:hypothetical protein